MHLFKYFLLQFYYFYYYFHYFISLIDLQNPDIDFVDFRKTFIITFKVIDPIDLELNPSSIFKFTQEKIYFFTNNLNMILFLFESNSLFSF